MTRLRRFGSSAGGVVDLDFMGSHGETKFIAIDKQANRYVVHLGRLGKVDRFARETLDPRAQRQMFPLNLLGVAFAGHMGFGGQMSGVRPPVIGEEARDAKGLQQGFELQKHLVLATAKHIGQDLRGRIAPRGAAPPVSSPIQQAQSSTHDACPSRCARPLLVRGSGH